MSESRPRKPRFRRSSDHPPLQLTERDFLILHQISIHRFLRSDHVRKLIEGSEQHLTRRLGRLYHAGLVDRPRQQRSLAEGTGSFVYCLTERGRKTLLHRGERTYATAPRIRQISTGLQLGHDLRVTDIVVTLRMAALRDGHTFHLHHEWSPVECHHREETLCALKWRIRTSGHGSLWVIPDAAFSIQWSHGGESYFLLEVDRGTMPVNRTSRKQTSFVRKVDAYRETRSIGVLWKRWQVPGFRVLVVTESANRRRSLQAGTADCFRYRKSNMFLFAVAGEILGSEDPLQPIWEDCAKQPTALVPVSSTES